VKEENPDEKNEPLLRRKKECYLWRPKRKKGKPGMDLSKGWKSDGRFL